MSTQPDLTITWPDTWPLVLILTWPSPGLAFTLPDLHLTWPSHDLPFTWTSLLTWPSTGLNINWPYLDPIYGKDHFSSSVTLLLSVFLNPSYLVAKSKSVMTSTRLNPATVISFNTLRSECRPSGCEKTFLISLSSLTLSCDFFLFFKSSGTTLMETPKIQTHSQ